MGRIGRFAAAAGAAALAGTGFAASAEVAGAGPVAYAVADGDGGPCQFGTVDLATGAFDPIGAPDFGLCVFDLTVAPDGTVYGILLEFSGIERDGATPAGGGLSPWFLQTIDPATGTVVSSERIGVDGNNDGGEGGGVAFAPDGALFAEYVPENAGPPGDCQEGDAYCLAAVDPADPGAAAVIGPGPTFVRLESLTITCGGELFVSQEGAQPSQAPGGAPSAAGDWAGPVPEVLVDASLASVDPATGGTSEIGPFGQLITGHDVDPAGTLWGVGFAVGGPPTVFTIDTATGAATPTVPITNADNGLLAIAIDHPCPAPPPPPPVPIEPTFTG